MTKEEMALLVDMLESRMDKKFDSMDRQFDSINKKIDKLDDRMERVESNTEYILKWVDGIDQDVKNLKLVK